MHSPLVVGNVDQLSASYAWTIDSSPPLKCDVKPLVKAGHSNMYNSTEMSVAVSGSDEAIVSVEYRWASDGTWQIIRDVSSSNVIAFTVDVAVDGKYEMLLKGRDAAGNLSPQPCATFLWEVDTLAPLVAVTSPHAGMRTRLESVNLLISSSELLSALMLMLPGGSEWVKYVLVPGAVGRYNITINQSMPGPNSVLLQGVDLVGNRQHAPVNYSWVVDRTPPSLWLQSAPSRVIASTAVLFNFASSEPLVGMWVSVDSLRCDRAVPLSVENTAASVNVSATSDGVHTLCLKAVDLAGNVFKNVSFTTWVLDTVPPQQCGVLMQSPHVEHMVGDKSIVRTNHSSVLIQFSSNKEAGVHYLFRVDGGIETRSFKELITIDTSSDGLHNVTVRVMDAAGNSLAEPCATLEWVFDSESPVVNVVQHQMMATRDSNAVLDVNASEELSQLWQRSSAGWEVLPGVDQVVTNVTGDGVHWLLLKGVDLVGNVQPVATNYSWLLDTTPPSVWLVDTDSLPMVTASASVVFSVHRESGAFLWWALDAGGWAEVTVGSSFAVAAVGDGEHKLHLKTADQLGNTFVNTSAWSWFLDTSPPVSNISTGPLMVTKSSQASFQVNCSSLSPMGASDCVSYEYSLQLSSGSCGKTGTFGSSGKLDLYGLLDGTNTLKVTAVDAVGLRQAIPATYTWRVEALATDLLDVNITTGPPGVYAWKTATLGLFAHHNRVPQPGSLFEVKVGRAPWAIADVLCDSGGRSCNYTLYDLALGAHEVQVRARRAGSTIPGQPSTWRWSVAECTVAEFAEVNR